MWHELRWPYNLTGVIDDKCADSSSHPHDAATHSRSGSEIDINASENAIASINLGDVEVIRSFAYYLYYKFVCQSHVKSTLQLRCLFRSQVSV
jgi:hypothetical protein